jgi:hypothetical protein
VPLFKMKLCNARLAGSLEDTRLLVPQAACLEAMSFMLRNEYPKHARIDFDLVGFCPLDITQLDSPWVLSH